MRTLDKETVARAILSGKKEINFKGKVYQLPNGQTAGTETQKLFYARKKAEELLKS
jgi:hypothetical protein